MIRRRSIECKFWTADNPYHYVGRLAARPDALWFGSHLAAKLQKRVERADLLRRPFR